MKFKDTLLSGVLLGVGMFTWNNAQANMIVYPMAAEINSSHEEATSLFVYSKSENVQYIRTRIMRIEHPGMPQEKEVPAEDNTGSGLVVSPEKFALSPGTKKTIRVISTQAPEKEEAWRIYFEAVPELDEAPQADGKRNSSVSVNLVWGVLLRVSPSDPEPALVTDGHHLLNTGNTRLSLIRAGNCDTICHWQNIDKSIYPGGSADIPAGIKSNAFRVEYHSGENSPVITADLTAAGK
ncbi:fimbrial protein TcfA [Salmonella enterica subsp. enterica serovar Rubislaw]|nr:fimbrial protein TcfA [Salmonella enterica subsp. enterica serovar Rubislaw]